MARARQGFLPKLIMEGTMRRNLDTVELEYERAIAAACNRGDSDIAYELSVGLKQYRELYQVRP